MTFANNCMVEKTFKQFSKRQKKKTPPEYTIGVEADRISSR